MGYVFNVAYGVGKAAVDRMAKDMAIELAPYGVTAVSLWPGVVRTEYLQAAAPSTTVRTTMGAAGTSDIADAALVSVAASRGADIVTGDREDMQRLVAKSRRPLRIVGV